MARAPHAAVAQDRAPADRLLRSCRLCAVGAAIHEQPDREPHESCRTGHNERGTPAVLQRQPCDQRRRNRRADHRAGGVDTDREAALLHRKVFCDCLRSRGVDAGLADAEHQPRKAELSRIAHPTRGHVRHRPPAQEQRERELRAELVRDPARAQIRHSVCDQEVLNDARIAEVVDAQVLLHLRGEYRQRLAVDVVEHGRREQHCQDRPAKLADAHAVRVGRRCGCVHLYPPISVAAARSASTSGAVAASGIQPDMATPA